ncbi:MAG: glycosyltransferase [Saprospiraceae bacterium]
MKIIICVSNDLTYDQRMQRIAGSFSKNHEVELVGRKLKNSVDLEKKNYAQKRINLLFNRGILFYTELNIRLFFFLLFRKADCYYAVDLDTIVPVTLVAKLKSKKCIFDAHELFEEVPELLDRPLKKYVWEWVAKKFIPKQNLCITVSPALAEYLESKYHIAFVVIRNVPYQKKTTPTDKTEKIILYQGALNVGRGLEEMIDAMSRIPTEYKLIIIGDGDIAAQLKEKAKNSPRKHDIQFTGYLRPQDIEPYTEAAWLGLNLIDNRSLSYYYSLANKFFDYIQVGVPCINMDFPEYRRINQSYQVSILLDSLDPTEIAHQILKLGNDPELYQHMVTECHRAAKEYTWENEEMVLKGVVENICA